MPEMIQSTTPNSTQALDVIHLENLRNEAVRSNQRFCSVQFDGVSSKKQVLDRIAEALGFPEYFGGNLDALFDCMTDLDLGAHAGFVIALEKLPQTTGFSEQERKKILEVLRNVAEFWADQKVPFRVFYSLA